MKDPSLNFKQYYALKELNLQKFRGEERMKEIFVEKRVLSEFKHDWIVRLYQSFGAKNKLYLLLEYCE